MGCRLLSAAHGKLFASATDSRTILEVDSTTGSLTQRKLSASVLPLTADGDSAYGCALGGKVECRLTRVPLDGGRAAPIADIPIGVTSGALRGDGSILVDAATAIDGSSFALVGVDLATGAKTTFREAIGVGDFAVAGGVVHFSGALEPKDNVGSPSYGLWALRGASAPVRLPASEVDVLGADASSVYYLTPDRELRRTAIDGSLDEVVVPHLDGPETEPGKLGIQPGVVVTDERVFVSLANGNSCVVLAVDKPR